MTVELLQTLSTVFFIGAGVLLLVAIALFFLLDVPKLYSDVSGRTARKAIEEIRKHNEETGNKAYKPSAVNAERGKLTDKILTSGKIQRGQTAMPITIGTEKLSTETLILEAAETSVLPETAMYDSAETSVLPEVVQAPSAETTVLPVSENTEMQQTNDETVSVSMEVSFTGSAEIIE
ncbi:MAG: hypothetical protein IKI99_00130 [Firmicutes bacterium]|nr:hypothetical protein [Bacillota bacterium]